MKCMHCQAQLERGKVPYHVDREGVHITLDEVAAWVCPQCGEHFFEADDIDAIQELVRSVEAEASKVAQRA